MSGRIVIGLCALGALAALCGCSLFHRETPQQKFLDALSRGNSAEASQIWLNMSEQDRMKFAHGEGVTPAVPPEKMNEMLSQMRTEEGKPVTIQSNVGKALTDLQKYANQPEQKTPAAQVPP
jgi:redox-sensitive bicupin YhaK (pirin superfamily)